MTNEPIEPGQGPQNPEADELISRIFADNSEREFGEMTSSLEVEEMDERLDQNLELLFTMALNQYEESPTLQLAHFFWEKAEASLEKSPGNKTDRFFSVMQNTGNQFVIKHDYDAGVAVFFTMNYAKQLFLIASCMDHEVGLSDEIDREHEFGKISMGVSINEDDWLFDKDRSTLLSLLNRTVAGRDFDPESYSDRNEVHDDEERQLAILGLNRYIRESLLDLPELQSHSDNPGFNSFISRLVLSVYMHGVHGMPSDGISIDADTARHAWDHLQINREELERILNTTFTSDWFDNDR